MGDKDVGLVGLGIMGRPMARKLMKADYSLTVYDVVGTAVEELATEGAKPASSSREVAQDNPVVITMVPDSADSEAAILGPNGVLEGASSGSTIIDMSSIAPGSSQKIGAACDEAGVHFLDAPVSGGEPKAVDGTLAIMVGGKKEVFDRYTDLLGVMGGQHRPVRRLRCRQHHETGQPDNRRGQHRGGRRGAGACQEGRPRPQRSIRCHQGGLAGSTVMDAKAPMMIAGDFKPGFRIRLHQKDLHNALLTGKELGVPLPVTGLIQQMLGALMNDGKGDSDHSAIANFLEDMAHTKISG